MKRLSDLAIDHPRVVIVSTIIVLMMAGFAALLTPVQRSPAITKAVVVVAIPYPDSQPSEAENEIARKVEDALTQLEDVDFLVSTSLRGSSVTQVVFLDGVDSAEARRTVKDLVDRIRNELPAGREVQPRVDDVDFEGMPLLLVNITPPPGFDDRALKTFADDVLEELETVPGVSNIQLFGGKEREIHVNVNPDLMTESGVSLAEMRQALFDFHAEVPAGEFSQGSFDRSIRNETKLRGVDDIREAIVSSNAGRVIRVKDVARVIDTHRKVTTMSEFDGGAGAVLIVNKEADINTLGAARAVKAKVAELQEQHPDFQFATTRDASEEIWVMFRVLGASAVFGAMLVLVILAWTMGLRISLLVLLAIPFSMAVGLVFLFATGVPVSNMVVFAFILVLGMVVDGAIIVAENIHRHIERGEDPVDAAKIGIHEVGLPVIAADLTTVAAFLPMLLVPGIMGDFMGVMPKVVTVSLLGSILVDHFIIPTIAARCFRRREPKSDESQSFTALASGGSATAAKARIRPSVGPFTRLYAAGLRAALANRVMVIVWCLIGCWGAQVLIMQLGFNFFPASDRGQFIVRYELPLGYTCAETLAAAEVITEPLRDWEDTGVLLHYVTSVGYAGGISMRVDDDPASGPEFGQVQVELVPPMDRSIGVQEVIQYLRENIKPVPGMKFSVEEVEDGPPGGGGGDGRPPGQKNQQQGEGGPPIPRPRR
ncbi:MAG: efflux RND transporter permease subunit, partial [Planctomycetota bacterium]